VANIYISDEEEEEEEKSDVMENEPVGDQRSAND